MVAGPGDEQFDAEDSQVVRQAVEDLRVTAHRYEIIRTIATIYVVVVITAAAWFGGWNVYRQKQLSQQNNKLVKDVHALVESGRQSSLEGRAIIKCALAELGALRINSSQAHDVIAQKVGVPDVPPPDGMVDVPPDVNTACADVPQELLGEKHSK